MSESTGLIARTLHVHTDAALRVDVLLDHLREHGGRPAGYVVSVGEDGIRADIDLVFHEDSHDVVYALAHSLGWRVTGLSV